MINRDGVQKIIKISLFVFIILVVTIYSVISFKDYVDGPQIEVMQPINGSSIASSTTLLKGQVKRIKDVSINNRPLLIDTQGNFTYNLLLLDGYNIFIISAIDKFGRTTEYKLELVH